MDKLIKVSIKILIKQKTSKTRMGKKLLMRYVTQKDKQK